MRVSAEFLLPKPMFLTTLLYCLTVVNLFFRVANKHYKETSFFSLKGATQPIDEKLAEQQVLM